MTTESGDGSAENRGTGEPSGAQMARPRRRGHSRGQGSVGGVLDAWYVSDDVSCKR